MSQEFSQNFSKIILKFLEKVPTYKRYIFQNFS